MRNVGRQIAFLVALLGTSAAVRDALAEELSGSLVQAVPDAGATSPATPVASDAGTGQLPDLQPSNGQQVPVDGGLAALGNAVAASDARSPAEILRDPPTQPSDIAHAERRVPSSEPATLAVAVHAAPAAANRLPLLGAMADIGVPDGRMGSLVVRPLKWLRAAAGGGTNSISRGWRAGVTLLPFGAGPSASLEYGQYQDGDANGLAKTFLGKGFDGSPALERVGYEFMNAHLGLDFGSRNFVFFIHGGVTMLRGQIHNLDAATRDAGATGATEVVVRQDPHFKAVGPSVKLGLLVYVW